MKSSSLKFRVFFPLIFSFFTTLFLSSCEEILDSISDPANNPEFIVNTTDDTSDTDLTDNLCADANGNCSLRAAIQQVNSNRKVSYTIRLYGGSGINTYEIDSMLIIKGGLVVNIEGESSDNTIIKARGSRYNSPLIYIYTEEEISLINLKNLTLTGGYADIGGKAASQPSGGGLLMSGNSLSVTLENVIVKENTALVHGGGIANIKGTLNLKNCVIEDNSCLNRSGGGIFNMDKLFIENSAIVKNASGTATSATSSGAGIMNTLNGFVSVINSTISQNTTTRRARRSGIGLYNSGKMRLRSCTIMENYSEDPSSGTGIYNEGDSLIFTNTAVVESNLEGVNYHTFGGNFIDLLPTGISLNGSSTWADQFAMNYPPLDAKLGSLTTLNGTWYHLPLSNSPLIDKGTGFVPGVDHPDACLDIDQRGVTRTGLCDIGAIEVR